MKALTIQQPWAGLIATGWKRIETRKWQTKYRGPIAILVGKTEDVEAVNVLYKHKGIITGPHPRGEIIAIAELIDIKEYKSQQEWLEDDNLHLCGFLEPTKYGWVFGKITPLEVTVPWRGMPGLFEVEIP